MYIIISLLLVICIILLILDYNKTEKSQKRAEEKYLQKHKEELDKEIEKYRGEMELMRIQVRQDTDEKIRLMKQEADQERRIVQAQQEAAKQIIQELESKQEIALRDYDLLLEEKKKARKIESDTQLAAEVAKARAEATVALTNFLTAIDNEKIEAQQQIEELKTILSDYQQKTKTVNEAILRQRAIDEQQDFYRVCLPESTVQDIELLNEIRPRLHHRESLDKLIYDVYISKPAQETIKRVLGDDKDKGGIYKITRISTGEIYIGKAASFKDRWGQHIKSAFNVGTIADSLLHRKMREDGITNYTFEVLEILPTDKQSEREKYWIEFYESKIYGLNQRLG